MRQPPPMPGSTSPSPPVEGTAPERSRLTAGAKAIPPTPAANVPSSAARPIGSPERGVGVGVSMV